MLLQVIFYLRQIAKNFNEPEFILNFEGHLNLIHPRLLIKKFELESNVSRNEEN